MMMPERIGRYPVVEELGRGGFATVFLAEDRSLDDLVAIKLLSDTYSNNPDIVSRFIAEARVMRELAAPGLVTVYDSGEHEGQPFFVMEYCRRGTLSERLEQLGRPITVEESYGLAQAMGHALSGVHRANPPVVHRDLKPGNLLIRHTPRHPQPVVGDLFAADEELIVGDFGLAKIVSQGATNLSLIAYTQGYASPEQVRGDPTIDTSADVYSAAAVIASAMTGVMPAQVFVPEQQAFPDEVMAATGPLRAVLERSLSYERGYRPTTMNQWSEFLTMPTPRVEEQAPQTRFAAPPTPGLEQRVNPSLSEFPPPAPRAARAASGAYPGEGPTAQTEIVPDQVGGPPAVQPGLSQYPPPGQPPPQPVPSQYPAPGRPQGPAPSAEFQPPPIHPVAPAQPAVAPASSPSSSIGRRLGLLAAGAVVVVLAGVAAFTLLTGSGPPIIGPSTGLVGDELAFAVPDAAVVEWRAGGQVTDDAVLRLTPTTPGLLTVTAETHDGSSEFTFEVEEPTSSLRIAGPGHLPIGDLTVLTVEGANGAEVTWTLDGRTLSQETLEVRPTAAGTLEVEVSIDGGSTSERTFTVAPG